VALTVIAYEFPLNEKIRNLLRLEDLHHRARYFAAKDEAADHHVALLTLFEILEVAGRADIKSELIQELERQKQHLESLRGNPAIAGIALTEILKEIDCDIAALVASSGKTGQELRDNEWLMGIKQRTVIPGGVCEFDIPSYHYWLNLPLEKRRSDIESWLAPFSALREGARIVLKLLRENGKTSAQIAQHGVYQQMMGGRTAQLIRIGLESEHCCVPEISANKYAINIRFITAETVQRKTQNEDVNFSLTFCNL
jgi:cell division protein ZapD